MYLSFFDCTAFSHCCNPRLIGVSFFPFSMKESLYKAMHPLICQYVGFQEAEVTPHVDGTATVVWNLKSGAHTRFGVVTTHWRRLGEYFLTSASVTLNEK
jgi:4'-phosphopantetheinyl transferase EntD